jgi:hypothetical protein
VVGAFEYRIEFLTDPPVVVVTSSGPVDPAGWASLHEALLADPHVRGLPMLVDHSALDATFLLGDAARKMGEVASDMDKELRPPRRAIVIAPGFEFGLMRTSRAQLDEDVDVEPRVREFRSREAALAWLIE